jgi:hypothetical protein
MPRTGKHQGSARRQAADVASTNVTRKTWEPAIAAIKIAAQLADLQQQEQWLQHLQDTISKPDSKLEVSGEFLVEMIVMSGKLWQLLEQAQPSELLQQVRELLNSYHCCEPAWLCCSAPYTVGSEASNVYHADA